MDSEKYLQFQVRAHIRAKLLVVFHINYDSLRKVRTPSATLTPSIQAGPQVQFLHPQTHCLVFSALDYSGSF